MSPKLNKFILQLNKKELSGSSTLVRFKSSVTKLKVVYTSHEIVSARKVLEKVLANSKRVVREDTNSDIHVTGREVITVVLEP